MSERAPYSRVYWSIVDDPKFASIYDNDRHLACWLRLLMVADMAWPASAQVPASARKLSVSELVRVGLVDVRPGDRFRIHGLDAERGRRKAAATRTNDTPTGTQQGPNREPNGPRTTGLRRDETRRDETSTTREHLPDDGRTDLEAFLVVRHRVPSPAQRDLMDAYVRVFDVTGPERAAALIYAHPDDPIGALKADLEAFRKERVTEAGPEPKPQPRKRNGLSPLNQRMAHVLGEQYRLEDDHFAGKHQAPVTDCRKCPTAVTA